MIHHSRERVSTAPDSNGSVLYTSPPLRLTLHNVILGLCAAAWPWKPIFINLSMNSSSECCNPEQTIFTCYGTQNSCSMSLCGLPLCG
uniref:Uncharacterized protein n=2 Tax=Anguilla anguilla TaxID=7936 RepID=A0A0E9S9A1_ANGAN